jgi:6-phosphogluconolactonase
VRRCQFYRKEHEMRRISNAGGSLAAVLALTTWVAPVASAHADGTAFVFTSTNSASGNSVLAYERAGDGSLSPVGSTATGGLGTGTGLGSQGALALSHEGKRRLFVVNAGSNSVSEFSVNDAGLTLLGATPSGGTDPISVTVSDGLVYVLNAGAAGSAANISGFRIGEHGLSPIAGSTQPLSAPSAGPAQIAFDPTGHALVVTEKATNLIDTYVVGSDGRAQAPASHASAGHTPFGFAFDRRGDLIVSEAFGGAPGAGAVSSYTAAEDGSLSLISGPIGDIQSAPCWVVTTGNGRYAYTSNTGSAARIRVGLDRRRQRPDRHGGGPQQSVPVRTRCGLTRDQRLQGGERRQFDPARRRSERAPRGCSGTRCRLR